MAKGEPKRVPELICFDFGGGISIKTEGCLVFLGFHEIFIEARRAGATARPQGGNLHAFEGSRMYS